MDYIQNLKTAFQLLSNQKQVSGRFVYVRLYGINGKIIKTRAKIDTGAFTSSIGKKLLTRLGYENIVNLLNSEDFVSLTRDDSLKVRDQIDETKLKAIVTKNPQITNIGRIISSNGIELRPFFNMKIRIGNSQKVEERLFNIANRKGLRNHVILGRNALRNLVVDVDIDYHRAIRKKK